MFIQESSRMTGFRENRETMFFVVGKTGKQGNRNNRKAIIRGNPAELKGRRKKNSHPIFIT